MCNKKCSTEIINLHEWLAKHSFKYYTLNSLCLPNAIKTLCKKNNTFGVFIRQIYRISPFNVRNLFAFKNYCNVDAQSITLLCIAYLLLYKRYEYDSFKKSLDFCENKMLSLKAQKYRDAFALQQSHAIFVSFYHSDKENVVPIWTALSGVYFLLAYHLSGEESYINLAQKVGNYFIYFHPRQETDKGIYYSYVGKNAVQIYNASAVISAFLFLLGSLTNDKLITDFGVKGIDFICNSQQSNGLWFYGNIKSKCYIDNFHTSYILLSLYFCLNIYDNRKWYDVFHRGIRFYFDHFFKNTSGNSLRPRHFHPNWIPRDSNIIQKVDLRDAATSTILFTVLSNSYPEYKYISNKILSWTNSNMKNGQTYIPEITWLWKNKIPYLEYQSWMFLALAVHEWFINTAD